MIEIHLEVLILAIYKYIIIVVIISFISPKLYIHIHIYTDDVKFAVSSVYLICVLDNPRILGRYKIIML